MKRAGIWLDFREAFVIDLSGDSPSTTRIASGIEDFHVKGGARSKTPYGPMDKTSESKFLERRLHQTREYFTHILELVGEAEELYLFGPAEAKVQLHKEIEHRRSFRPAVLSIETADKMTDRQKIARAKAFFDSFSAS
ncbi:MAG: hypothetical protein KDC43_05030 [Saprospiraceae bacterium]|nr:hypothetical protein [Saprospiraceae bacterium]MCB0623284.1 hypothetical protein [Saprospiraceae bacterium]MCB0675072.1 hypothetical protein [Saprospiraceae bacterium]MCB0684593.1 hypothetical protein [Saprospiraceae bacterium]